MGDREDDVLREIPEGFRELITPLIRDVIVQQPENIPAFAAQYFQHLVHEEEKASQGSVEMNLPFVSEEETKISETELKSSLPESTVYPGDGGEIISAEIPVLDVPKRETGARSKFQTQTQFSASESAIGEGTSVDVARETSSCPVAKDMPLDSGRRKGLPSDGKYHQFPAVTNDVAGQLLEHRDQYSEESKLSFHTKQSFEDLDESELNVDALDTPSGHLKQGFPSLTREDRAKSSTSSNSEGVEIQETSPIHVPLLSISSDEKFKEGPQDIATKSPDEIISGASSSKSFGAPLTVPQAKEHFPVKTAHTRERKKWDTSAFKLDLNRGDDIISHKRKGDILFSAKRQRFGECESDLDVEKSEEVSVSEDSVEVAKNELETKQNDSESECCLHDYDFVKKELLADLSFEFNPLFGIDSLKESELAEVAGSSAESDKDSITEFETESPAPSIGIVQTEDDLKLSRDEIGYNELKRYRKKYNKSPRPKFISLFKDNNNSIISLNDVTEPFDDASGKADSDTLSDHQTENEDSMVPNDDNDRRRMNFSRKTSFRKESLECSSSPKRNESLPHYEESIISDCSEASVEVQIDDSPVSLGDETFEPFERHGDNIDCCRSQQHVPNTRSSLNMTAVHLIRTLDRVHASDDKNDAIFHDRFSSFEAENDTFEDRELSAEPFKRDPSKNGNKIDKNNNKLQSKKNKQVNPETGFKGPADENTSSTHGDAFSAFATRLKYHDVDERVRDDSGDCGEEIVIVDDFVHQTFPENLNDGQSLVTKEGNEKTLGDNTAEGVEPSKEVGKRVLESQEHVQVLEGGDMPPESDSSREQGSVGIHVTKRSSDSALTVKGPAANDSHASTDARLSTEIPLSISRSKMGALKGRKTRDLKNISDQSSNSSQDVTLAGTNNDSGPSCISGIGDVTGVQFTCVECKSCDDKPVVTHALEYANDEDQNYVSDFIPPPYETVVRNEYQLRQQECKKGTDNANKIPPNFPPAYETIEFGLTTQEQDRDDSVETESLNAIDVSETYVPANGIPCYSVASPTTPESRSIHGAEDDSINQEILNYLEGELDISNAVLVSTVKVLRDMHLRSENDFVDFSLDCDTSTEDKFCSVSSAENETIDIMTITKSLTFADITDENSEFEDFDSKCESIEFDVPEPAAATVPKCTESLDKDDDSGVSRGSCEDENTLSDTENDDEVLDIVDHFPGMAFPEINEVQESLQGGDSMAHANGDTGAHADGDTVAHVDGCAWAHVDGPSVTRADGDILLPANEDIVPLTNGYAVPLDTRTFLQNGLEQPNNLALCNGFDEENNVTEPDEKAGIQHTEGSPVLTSENRVYESNASVLPQSNESVDHGEVYECVVNTSNTNEEYCSVPFSADANEMSSDSLENLSSSSDQFMDEMEENQCNSALNEDQKVDDVSSAAEQDVQEPTDNNLSFDV